MAWTVKQLREQLENEEANTEVYFAHPSRDFWRTELASPVVKMEVEPVVYSDYHSQYATCNNDDDQPEDAKHVLVLRS